MSTYLESQRRKKLLPPSQRTECVEQTQKALLEAHVEYTKAALASSQERTTQLAAHVKTMEEKVAGLTQVMKLLQSYMETREQSAAKDSTDHCPEARRIVLTSLSYISLS